MNDYNPAITGILRTFARTTPDKTALIIGEEEVSYARLYRLITGAARFLQGRGIKEGSHVLSEACPCLPFIVYEYAVLGLGAVHIPAENRAPGGRLGEIARAVDAELVISHEKPEAETEWLSLAELPLEEREDPGWIPVPVSDACSEIIFTTGTTGRSKGVMLSPRCLEVYLAALNPSFGIRSESVFLVTTPLNHVGGMHRIHQCFSVGCTAVLMDGIRNLKGFFDAIYRHGVTHTYLPPASVKMLITLAKKEVAALDSRLEFIYTASAPFPTKDMETFISLLPHVRLHQGYGSSETGSISNCRYNAPGKTISSLGKPYDCVEVVLEDEEGNLITEAGRPGFIRSRSGMNMLGYYKEPELTAQTLKDGFIYSKDLLYFDEEGELHFAGRGDDVINIRGFKVAPPEVEEAALQFPKLEECVCVPFEDKAPGRVMKMVVVMKEGEVFDREEITAFLAEKLEDYKLPRILEQLDAIPRTFNGKIDRRKLMEEG